MADPTILDDLSLGFNSKYEDIRQKVLVAEQVTNHRLESNLTIGATVNRYKLDLSKVRVRTETRYSDRTLDKISHSKELITVDQEKYMGFPLHKNDILQNGPLKAGEEAGKQIAIKAMAWLDGFYLSKVKDAYDTFDAGDIGGSAGAPIDFATSGNVDKIITLAPAKIRTNHVDLNNLGWVLDPIALAYVELSLLGKSINLANSVFQNGYAGPVHNGDMYVSDNLTFEAEIDLSTKPTADDTITIGGVVFTFKAAAAAAGDVKIGADASAAAANLVKAINGAAGGDGTNYFELAEADRITISDTLRCVASVDGSNKLSLMCIGAGRVTVSDGLTAAVNWANTRLHGYAGKKKQIDVIQQREINLDKRPEPKQPVDNYFVDFLAGAFVFDDAKQNFLDLWIKV